MAFVNINVVGQPSVVYLRRSQPSSRYHSVSAVSLIFWATSASLYVLSFSLAMEVSSDFLTPHLSVGGTSFMFFFQKFSRAFCQRRSVLWPMSGLAIMILGSGWTLKAA